MNCSTPGFPVLHSLIICWNSCSLSQWCHPAFSSSVTPFSSCPQSLPTSGSFPMSQLFTLGGQSFEASALSWVLPMNIQGQFPSRLNVICIKWQFYLFPSNLDIFLILFLVWLLWLGLPIVCWIHTSGENGQLSLIPEFSRKHFSFSQLSIILAVGLS